MPASPRSILAGQKQTTQPTVMATVSEIACRITPPILAEVTYLQPCQVLHVPAAAAVTRDRVGSAICEAKNLLSQIPGKPRKSSALDSSEAVHPTNTLTPQIVRCPLQRTSLRETCDKPEQSRQSACVDVLSNRHSWRTFKQPAMSNHRKPCRKAHTCRRASGV